MAPARADRLPTGTVTFLFTDVEGSTRLLTALGGEYPSLLAAHHAITRSVLAEHHGTEISTEGDAFFAAFESALDAVAAAAEAQRRLMTARWPEDVSVRVRMGLHSGVGRLGGDSYVGMDVHRAARVAAAAHGGQVLLSDATRALVEADLPAGLALEDLGEHRLKDLPELMRIFQLRIHGLPSDFPPPTSLGARENLPAPLTSFIGRARELAQVRGLLGEQRLVTLTGPGGTGKTRLALQLAGQLRRELGLGAVFVDLAPIRDPALIALRIAQALGLSVDPGGDALAATKAHLEQHRLLLIIDNFEQVLDGAPLIGELLADVSSLRVLVTSRVPLHLYGEQVYEVPPLELPGGGGPTAEPASNDGVALFVDRARAVKPDLQLTDETTAVIARIVARLDGLPLAIELAASRMRVLGPAALLARLDRRLPLLTLGGRSRPERQQTMQATIDWSYDLLDVPERTVFSRLSVFPGGCSVGAAEQVCDAGDLGAPVTDSLAALVDKSLLRAVAMPDGEPRFSMLETILEYADERLRVDFDEEATLRRLAQFLMALAEEAEPQLTGANQVRWLDGLELEAPNLRRALSWTVEAGEAEVGLRTAAALWRFWQQRGPLREGRIFLGQLLALPGATARTRARGLSAEAGLAWWASEFDVTPRTYEEALNLYRQSGDRLGETEALYDLGIVLAWTGPEGARRAEELLNQSAALAEEHGDRLAVARAQTGLAYVSAAGTDYETARRMLEDALAVFADVGDRLKVIDTVIGLGNIHRRLGEQERAGGYYLRGLDMTIASGNRPMTTGLLFLLSALEVERGRFERAARLWGAAESAKAITGAVRPAVADRLIGDPVAAARQALGDAAVETTLAAGRAMSSEAAIAYAHEDA